MNEFFGGLSLFSLVLTFGTYQIGLWCRKKWDSPLCSPILIAVILIMAVLLLTGISNDTYQTGISGISWLLTPATVCLALPLYQQIKVLRSRLYAILAGVSAGTVTSLISVFFLCRLFQLDTAVTASLLPKSITTAMGIVLSEQGGGLPPLTAAAIILTGILGSLTGSALCRLLKLTDPVAQGTAFGTASHVIGTSQANELGSLQGAVSSLSLAVAGVLTAVLYPLLTIFL